jgi:hypothetical protein
MKRTFIDKLTMGYRFDREREVVTLLYLCYFSIVLFGIVLFLLHNETEDLTLVSYRYHAIILVSLIMVWLVRIRLFALARVIMLGVIPFLLIILPRWQGSEATNSISGSPMYPSPCHWYPTSSCIPPATGLP